MEQAIQDSFWQLIEAGDGHLNTRKTIEQAASFYEQAVELVDLEAVANDALEDPERQLLAGIGRAKLGIALRLLGQTKRAQQAFKDAIYVFGVLKNQEWHARTQRDLAMVYIDGRRDQLDAAYTLLNMSIKTFEELGPDFEVEVVVSKGFRLRFDLKTKPRSERPIMAQEAILLYWQLRDLGEELYALNALVWVLKLLPRGETRRYYARHGLELAKLQNNTQRRREIQILQHGGYGAHRLAAGITGLFR